MNIKKFLFCGGLIVLAASCKKNGDSNSSSSSNLSVKTISPTSGTSSILDTLTGTGFSATMTEDSVYFNGKSAAIVSATGTQLVVKVPVQAGTGNVSVVVKGKTASGPVFTFTGDSSYVVSTFAGNGSSSDIPGNGISTGFNYPLSLALDASGNLYISEYSGNVIRKITSAGIVTTLAGSGTPGGSDGTATGASFNEPSSVEADASGNIFVADWGNDEIRKVTQSGAVSTFAGALITGYVDATGSAARFYHPGCITVDGQGNVYVFDAYNNRIRKITSAGVVTTFVGTGTAGTADGTGTAASIGDLEGGMCTDASNNIYFADLIYGLVRKITPAGVVTTIAGTGDRDHPAHADGTGAHAAFQFPSGIAVDKYGNLFVAESGSGTIRKVTPAGVVTTIAGISGTVGSADGPGNKATFNNPTDIVVAPDGVLYVTDASNYKIRKLTPQ